MKTFSLISNLRTFLKTDGTPAGMESLNGIRVITIIWLILGHENFMRAPAISKYFQTYLFDMFHSHSVLPYVCFHVAENVLDVRPRLAKSFVSQLIVQCWLSVDTFFYLRLLSCWNSVDFNEISCFESSSSLQITSINQNFWCPIIR